VEVIALPSIPEADALRQELLSELIPGLADWKPVEVPSGTPRSADVPRLQVRIKHYRPRPAGSPLSALALPGAASMGTGFSILRSGRELQELAGAANALFGGGFLAVGVAALVVGIALESRKSYLDRKRGYPLHTFKAEVRISWAVNGRLKEEKEIFRALDLGPKARPLSVEDATDPTKVRLEMMRAFAWTIREDASARTGWDRPEED